MSEVTCASLIEYERLISFNFLISQIVDLLAVLITFVASTFAIKMVMTKSIFENSTIILLILNLFYAILYQIIYGIEAVLVIYKHFFMRDHRCDLLQLESTCAPYLKTLLGCASGMILCDTGLILERTFATFSKDCKSKKSVLFASLIAVFIIALSTQIGRIVYWDDTLNDFESMNNCATAYDLDRLSSWHLVICQSVHLLAILITFISSFYAIDIVWRKSIFQRSTQFIIFLNLLYANLHQISYGIEASQLLYKHFFMMDQPCKLLQYDADCAPYFSFLFAEIAGMFLCQTGLVVERACATFLKTYKKTKRMGITVIISLVVLSISACTGPFLLWNDSLTGYSFSCLSFPKTSFNKTYPFFITCSIVTFFNLITTISIMRYNKKEEYATRFKVGVRFRKREAIESTETVCFLALSQFILMFFYCGGVIILICIKSMTLVNFSSWVVWVYSVPFIAMMFPILLIYRIQAARANRVLIIKSFAESKHTQEDHIRQMKQTWGE
uniref:G_PROTEIN_RECEP_F1_2 domain-containing protein n=1 Tax=Caenorhabditis tropicalis TaxID=1561998 RepID=A0A1I7UFC3_9PELO